MKRSQAYPTKYLSAADIDNNPKCKRVTEVTSVTHEPMQDGKLKPCIFLAGHQKGVIVNATNANVLYDLAGSDDDEDWPGVAVEVFTEATRKPNGEPCRAIRFRPAPKTAAKKRAEVAENLDDEIPF